MEVAYTCKWAEQWTRIENVGIEKSKLRDLAVICIS